MYSKDLIRTLVSNSWIDGLVLRLVSLLRCDLPAFRRYSEELRQRALVRRIYKQLSPSERSYPRRIGRLRRNQLATSLDISPVVVDGAVRLLTFIQENFQLTVGDVLRGHGNVVFTERVLGVVTMSVREARTLGDTFVDSAHWLLSVYDGGSESLRQRFRSFGLDRDTMVNCRISLKGECPPSCDNGEDLYLSGDGVRTYVHLVRVYYAKEGRERVDECEFAAGLMRNGHSEAASILRTQDIDVSRFMEEIQR